MGFMKQALEIGSGAMTYIPSFIKTGSAIHRLMREGYVKPLREHGYRISLFLFFQNKESMLKICSGRPVIWLELNFITDNLL
jgi:hypothetical protein